MTDKNRLNLAFSMASPVQREAWELLAAIPAGQRTETVCRAVCRMYGQESLLETVRQTIREELRGAKLISTKEEPKQPKEAGDVDENVLGFLFALQREGDDD